VESNPVALGHCIFEYRFQVPANRYGSYEFTGAQLKTIQEVITLTVFSLFSITYVGETFKWNYAAGFAFICGACSSYSTSGNISIRPVVHV